MREIRCDRCHAVIPEYDGNYVVRLDTEMEMHDGSRKVVDAEFRVSTDSMSCVDFCVKCCMDLLNAFKTREFTLGKDYRKQRIVCIADKQQIKG
jgi:hypothetical protein